MKKLLALIATLMIVLVGCQTDAAEPDDNTAEESVFLEVYPFPEPTTQIKVTRSSQGTKTEFVIGPDVYDIEDTSVRPIMKWFKELELIKYKKAPEIVSENDYYDFMVDGRINFGYYEENEKAFLFIEDQCYEVKNPSTPPVD